MIAAPTEAELEEAEIYEEVLSPEVAELKLTDRAAEVSYNSSFSAVAVLTTVVMTNLCRTATATNSNSRE
jgi:hypothetical protein